MEALLVLSGVLLAKQYTHLKEKQKDSTPELLSTSTRPPWVDSDDNSGAVDRKAEFTEPSAPNTTYAKPWLRQFGFNGDAGQQARTVTELVHPSDETSEDNLSHLRVRGGMVTAALQTLDNRSAGVPVMEPERVRPPKMGGYDGYDEDRGRNPIPRYFQFNLGEDLTVDPLKLRDAGMSKGFAVGQAGKGRYAGNYHLCPDRDIIGGSNQRVTEAAVGGTWHRGQYDSTGLGRGTGGVQPVSAVRASDDPFDKRFRDESVMTSSHIPGSSRVGPVFRFEGAERMDRNVVKQFTSSTEGPFDKTRGSAVNPQSKMNYLGPAADYLQQPAQIQVDTVKPTPGVSRFSKHTAASSASLVKDKTQWTYTLHANDARRLLDAANPRKLKDNKAVAETRQEGVSQDKQVLRQELDLKGLETKAVTSNQRPVLFSDAERQAYKLDPRESVERNLERPGERSRGLAAFKGASSYSGNSYQYSVKDTKTVNSALRNTTSEETSGLLTGGVDRKPVHDLPVQVKFQQANTSIDSKLRPTLSDTVPKAYVGASREGVSQHPRREIAPPTQGLTVDKRDVELTAGSTSGRKTTGPVSRRTKISTYNDTLFPNDTIADIGGKLSLPGSIPPLNKAGRQRLGPGRESMQAKQPPVGKRK